jgi:5-methylcytosine-specific restriction endonuclease McrA
MSEIINWINSRGLKGEDYLGDLCKKNHEYLDTGKSVRCKPTDRPNGKCVCCSKESRDKSYRNNSQTKKDYYEMNKEYISRTRKEKYKLNMLNDDFRQKRNEYKAIQRRQKGMIPREELSLQSALKNTGTPSVVELIQKQIKDTQKQIKAEFLKTEQGKEQLRKKRNNKSKILYKNSFSNRIMHKEKRQRNKFQDSGNYAEFITSQQLINRFSLFNNSCAYCGSFEGLNIQMEHVVPRSKGGAHCMANIVPACHKCNQSKFNHSMEKWYKNQSFYSKERLNKIKQVLAQTPFPPKQQELLHDWQLG